MRILFSAQHFLNYVGGAELCAQTLLRELAARHEVHVLASGKGGDYDWNGVRVHEVGCWNNILYVNLFWSRYLNRLGFKPDLVLTQVNAAAPTVFWCKGRGIPCLMYVRSFEHFCLDSFKQGEVYCRQRCWRCEGVQGLIRYPAYKVIYDRNRRAIQEADAVVTQSRFMREVTEHYTGVEPDVLPMIVDLEKYVSDQQGDSILFVNPVKHKGVALVAELVKNMRKRRFTLAGGLDRDYMWLAEEPNVEYLGRVDDMKPVYGRARILLAPSSMADNYPRTVLEALANGLPVLASDVGGAAEAAGDAGIKLSTANVDAWTEAVDRLYEDQEFYESKRGASLKEAEKHGLDVALDALSKYVDERFDRRLL